MSAQHFNSQDFEQKVLNADKPVLVDFYADWCGPCQMAAPIIDKLAEEYADKMLIGKINIEEARDLAMQYQVMNIPTMIVFKNGKEVDRKIGFPGEQGIKKIVENLFK